MGSCVSCGDETTNMVKPTTTDLPIRVYQCASCEQKAKVNSAYGAYKGDGL